MKLGEVLSAAIAAVGYVATKVVSAPTTALANTTTELANPKAGATAGGIAVAVPKRHNFDQKFDIATAKMIDGVLEELKAERNIEIERMAVKDVKHAVSKRQATYASSNWGWGYSNCLYASWPENKFGRIFPVDTPTWDRPCITVKEAYTDYDTNCDVAGSWIRALFKTKLTDCIINYYPDRDGSQIPCVRTRNAICHADWGYVYCADREWDSSGGTSCSPMYDTNPRIPYNVYIDNIRYASTNWTSFTPTPCFEVNDTYHAGNLIPGFMPVNVGEALCGYVQDRCEDLHAIKVSAQLQSNPNPCPANQVLLHYPYALQFQEPQIDPQTLELLHCAEPVPTPTPTQELTPKIKASNNTGDTSLQDTVQVIGFGLAGLGGLALSASAVAIGACVTKKIYDAKRSKADVRDMVASNAYTGRRPTDPLPAFSIELSQMDTEERVHVDRISLNSFDSIS